MKVFTPGEQTPFPVQRGDSLLHRILKKGESYLLTDAAGEQWEGLICSGLASGSVVPIEARPPNANATRMLFFFDGDIGDALVVRPSIAETLVKRSEKEFGFVTPNGDWSLFPFSGCPVFEFPVTLRQAETFDVWAEFNFRQQGDVDPVVAFGTIVGLKPKEPIWTLAVPALERAVGRLLPQTGRPRVGLCLRTRSHYRSWYGQHASVVAAGLVEAGFDCYFLGPLNQRLEFRKEGEENVLWGDGLYDLQGRFATVEEHVACLANMDVVVAPDGGDLLIACALQKPTVGLFWCACGERYLPYAPTLTCLNARRECSPCWCNGDKTPCEEAYCLAVSTIDPEDVVNAVTQKMEAGHAP